MILSVEGLRRVGRDARLVVDQGIAVDGVVVLLLLLRPHRVRHQRLHDLRRQLQVPHLRVLLSLFKFLNIMLISVYFANETCSFAKSCSMLTRIIIRIVYAAFCCCCDCTFALLISLST